MIYDFKGFAPIWLQRYEIFCIYANLFAKKMHLLCCYGVNEANLGSMEH